MIKSLHIFFVLFSFFSFIARVILAATRPAVLKRKWLKISPHVVDTMLLLSGLTLVVQGHWLTFEYGWLVAKVIALLGYICFGTITMRQQGPTRWFAFSAALGCYLYIFIVAVSKNPWFLTY